MTERSASSSSAISGVSQGYPVEQNIFQPMLLAAVLVLVPMIAVQLFMDTQSMARGLKIVFGNWISPLIAWFFVASLLHLWFKRGRLRREMQLTDQLATRHLPGVVSTMMADTNANGLLQGLQQQLPAGADTSNNLLLSRLRLYLGQSSGTDADEAFGITEREYMRGSYALPRFMVWAIPILGFIGTVWGISNGIAHFSDAMTATQSVTDVSSMLKENLPLVTNSLSTAFDTTLLALLLSVPLMMVMIWLEKQEEAYLIQLDQRWFHEIKPQLLQHSGALPGQSLAGAGDATGMAPVQSVANEIKLLSSQVGALQETMEDLYETVFQSRLKNLGDEQ